MDITETNSHGRELTIQFTCSRCRAARYLPFKEAMTGDNYGYLHNSKLPEGWSEIGYSGLMCEACTKKFEEFMKG